jgi:glycosyltransferase involved in cell wall biosynthesis
VKIVLNAQLLTFAASYRNAGLSRYILALLRGFAEVGGEERITALVPAGLADDVWRALGADERSVGGRTLENARGVSPYLRILGTDVRENDPARRMVWEQACLPFMTRRLDGDVLHGLAHALPLWSPCAAVVTVHDLAFLRYPRYFRPARRSYQVAMIAQSVEKATRIVAISTSTRDELVTLLGVDAERVSVIPPAIDPDFVPCEDVERLAAFRAAHGLPAHYVLYLGTLEPRKNVAGLVEAYARLRAMEPETPPLVIAGAHGWYCDSLFQRVRALGLERVVLFPGYVPRDEQPLWYGAASLFVYPSLYEGFGLPVAEALACGVPVVTSERPGTRDAAGQVAMRADPSDLAHLAQAMRRMLSDSAIQRRMAVDGPSWARGFSCRRQALQYLDVYRQCGEMGARMGMRQGGESGQRDGYGSRRTSDDRWRDALHANLAGDLGLGGGARSPHRTRTGD